MNRHFGLTLVLLLVAAEGLLRLAPHLGDRPFRLLYGNSLAMMMTVRDRLERSADSVRILALGDSLAMTQFQPDLYGRMAGLDRGEVFNAAYLGMSFPSQHDLLHSVGLERFAELSTVLYFVNPRRLSSRERPNTDVLRVGVRPAGGAWPEVWKTKRIGPLLDASRLYGLSRHLVVGAWRDALRDTPSWDHVEYLGRHGGVAWTQLSETSDDPRYPYEPLERVSPERREEMQTVVRALRSVGAQVWLVPSALHPAVDPFASAAARSRFEQSMVRFARETGARYLGGALEDFEVDETRAFSDYGHMAAEGGAAYTRHVYRATERLLDARGRVWGG